MDDESDDALFLGTILKWFGLGLCFMGILLVVNRISNTSDILEPHGSIAISWTSWVIIVLGLFCTFTGAILLRIGLGHTVRTAEMARRVDTRKPVIYLRSFQNDGRNTHIPGNPLFSESIEQHLADRFLPIGPMIAIGDPNDKSPLVGVPRTYLDRWKSRTGALQKTVGPTKDWMEFAKQLMTEAALVIVSYDISDGLVQETDYLLNHKSTEQVLFLFREHRRWVDFRQRYARYFNESEPFKDELIQYLAFSEEGHPVVLSRYTIAPESDEAAQSDFGPGISSQDDRRVTLYIKSRAQGKPESSVGRWLRKYGLK